MKDYRDEERGEAAKISPGHSLPRRGLARNPRAQRRDPS